MSSIISEIFSVDDKRWAWVTKRVIFSITEFSNELGPKHRYITKIESFIEQLFEWVDERIKFE